MIEGKRDEQIPDDEGLISLEFREGDNPMALSKGVT